MFNYSSMQSILIIQFFKIIISPIKKFLLIFHSNQVSMQIH